MVQNLCLVVGLHTVIWNHTAWEYCFNQFDKIGTKSHFLSRCGYQNMNGQTGWCELPPFLFLITPFFWTIHLRLVKAPRRVPWPTVGYTKNSLFCLSQPKSKRFTPPWGRPRRAPRAFAAFRLATIYLPQFVLLKWVVVKYSVGSFPARPGWAPDPLMVGIRSPDGLVVGLAPATLLHTHTTAL